MSCTPRICTACCDGENPCMDCAGPQPCRQPSYDAVYSRIHEWKTDVFTNARIWRAVEAALDAQEARQ